jgi:hypothetical protein
MVDYKHLAKKQAYNHISKIIESSPIKPNFSVEQIFDTYMEFQEMLLRRGELRRHLIYLSAFYDIMDDREKMNLICEKFELNYGRLKRLMNEYLAAALVITI